MKIFVIKSYDAVNECITYFNCSVSDAIYKRKIMVSNKITALSKHFVQSFWKKIIHELATVHDYLCKEWLA